MFARGKKILTFTWRAKRSEVTDLAFSRDGIRLVASDWAGSVTVWNTAPVAGAPATSRTMRRTVHPDERLWR